MVLRALGRHEGLRGGRLYGEWEIPSLARGWEGSDCEYLMRWGLPAISSGYNQYFCLGPAATSVGTTGHQQSHLCMTGPWLAHMLKRQVPIQIVLWMIRSMTASNMAPEQRTCAWPRCWS